MVISSLNSLYVEAIPSIHSNVQEGFISPVVCKSVREVLVRDTNWADRQFGHGTRGEVQGVGT